MELPPHKDNFICSSIHSIVTRGLSKINNCLFRFFFGVFYFISSAYLQEIFSENPFVYVQFTYQHLLLPTIPSFNSPVTRLVRLSISHCRVSSFSISGQRIPSKNSISWSTPLRISALTPAIEVHHLPERLVGLCPPLLSVPNESAEIWVTCARDRSDIRRIPAGGEPPLTDLKRSGAGLPLASLICVAIHHRHARRHPNPIQITHPEYSNSR